MNPYESPRTDCPPPPRRKPTGKDIAAVFIVSAFALFVVPVMLFFDGEIEEAVRLAAFASIFAGVLLWIAKDFASDRF